MSRSAGIHVIYGCKVDWYEDSQRQPIQRWRREHDQYRDSESPLEPEDEDGDWEYEADDSSYTIEEPDDDKWAPVGTFEPSDGNDPSLFGVQVARLDWNDGDVDWEEFKQEVMTGTLRYKRDMDHILDEIGVPDDRRGRFVQAFYW